MMTYRYTLGNGYRACVPGPLSKAISAMTDQMVSQDQTHGILHEVLSNGHEGTDGPAVFIAGLLTGDRDG